MNEKTLLSWILQCCRAISYGDEWEESKKLNSFLLSRVCPPSAFCNENVLFIARVHLLHPLVHPCVVNHKSERRRKILLLRHERDVIESYRELTYENIIVSRICRSGDGEEVLKKKRIREKICEKFRRLGCIVNFQRGDRFRVRILLIVIEKRRGEGKKKLCKCVHDYYDYDPCLESEKRDRVLCCNLREEDIKK